MDLKYNFDIKEEEKEAVLRGGEQHSSPGVWAEVVTLGHFWIRIVVFLNTIRETRCKSWRKVQKKGSSLTLLLNVALICTRATRKGNSKEQPKYVQQLLLSPLLPLRYFQ